MPAPPISALEQLKTLDPDLVRLVNERFFREAELSPSKYEQSDLEQIRANQWQIQRFLLECKLNVEQAFEALNNAMQWRRNENVKNISDADFPAEYYQSGYIFSYGRDRNDATVIYFRANIHRKLTNEWNQRLKQFFIYQIEKIDQNSDGKGLSVNNNNYQI